jgi:fatty acid desaturase
MDRRPAIEWPTIALAAALHAAWIALCLFHASLPWWAFAACAAVVSAWFSSLQHEAIHGHPTRSATFNHAIACAPLWIWLPYSRYRDTHLLHHRDHRLTDPLDDPESRYVTPEDWAARGPIGRAALRAQSTLLGRLAIGPAWSAASFLRAEWANRRDPRVARAWAAHLALLLPFLAWTLWACGVPAWLYVLGFVQGGGALAMLRSFAEHRAHGDPARRTAVVENATLLGPVFLFNNLHATHHRWPGVAWYRLPALHRARRDELLAANGGLAYDGYGEVARRFLLRAHDQPEHPLGRAP